MCYNLNGDKVINIDINNLEELENDYNKKHINKDLEQYIMECAKLMPRKEKIELKINSNLNSIEQENAINLIHGYYKEKFKQYHLIDKYDDYVRIFLLILGIVFIIISEHLIDVLSELFLIAGWVVVWEIIYDLIFTGFKRKKTKSIYQKLSKCEISFSD